MSGQTSVMDVCYSALLRTSVTWGTYVHSFYIFTPEPLPEYRRHPYSPQPSKPVICNKYSWRAHGIDICHGSLSQISVTEWRYVCSFYLSSSQPLCRDCKQYKYWRLRITDVRNSHLWLGSVTGSCNRLLLFFLFWLCQTSQTWGRNCIANSLTYMKHFENE